MLIGVVAAHRPGRRGRPGGRHPAGTVRVGGLRQRGVLRAGRRRVQRGPGGEAVRTDDRVQVVGAVVGDRARPGRRARGDQPLVVEERPAEGRLEEVVGDRVVRRVGRVQVLVDRQLGGVVGAHRQADGVTAGDVAVLPAAVDLVLLVVEAVHQVTRAAAGQAGAVQHAVGREHSRGRTRRVLGLDVVVDPERRVAERRPDRRRSRGAAAGDRQRRRREVDVDLRQARQHAAVGGDLCAAGSRRPAR